MSLLLAAGAKVAGGLLSGYGKYKSNKGDIVSAESGAKIARLNAEKSKLNWSAKMVEATTSKALNLDTNKISWTYGGLTQTGTPGQVAKGVESSWNKDIDVMLKNYEIDKNIYKTQEKAYNLQAEAAKSANSMLPMQVITGMASDISSLYV